MIYFIYRKESPVYYSIEKVFARIATGLKAKYRSAEIRVPHGRLHPVDIIRNILFLKKYKNGIFHITGDAHYLALAFPSRRVVLTIHDCVFMYANKGIKRWILKKLLLDWPIKHSKVVTTISEHSKKDILGFVQCNPEKIKVIPNPSNAIIAFSALPENDVPQILFIGTTPNKNLDRVTVALKGVHCVLNIVGRIPAEQKAALDSNGIRFTECYQISEQELAEKYHQSDLVLFPSTFEGFGLPIIEAQQAGRPIITSNMTPMSDVAGDGAYLVDPYNVESIREAVFTLIDDVEQRKSLVKKGIENVKRFSLEQILQQYLDVYKIVDPQLADNGRLVN